MRYPLLLAAASLLAFGCATTTSPEPNETAPESVNAVIDDAGFERLFRRAPTHTTPEALRLTAHLAHVESELRAAPVEHLSFEQAAHRLESLDDLHDYWSAGAFPENTHTTARTPIFIDDHGTLCAVGHLLAETEGLDAAEAVNAAHRFDAIPAMTDMPELLAWADTRGFSLDELATIQPRYRPRPIDPPQLDPPVAPRPIKPPPIREIGPSPEQIRAVVATSQDTLAACFDAVSEADRPSNLRAILTLDVGGHVSHTSLDYAGDASAVACVQDTLMSLRFPPASTDGLKYRVDIRIPTETVVEPKPSLELGTLRFESETPRQVFIGGVLVGETPVEARVLLGSYDIALVSATGDTLTRTLHVDSAGKVVLNFP